MNTSDNYSGGINRRSGAERLGLLKRHAELRIRNATGRSLCFFVGISIVVHYTNVWIGLAAAIIATITEAADLYLLRDVMRAGISSDNYRKFQKLCTASALIQAIVSSTIIAIIWVVPPGASGHLYALAFWGGATVYAGMSLGYNRPIALVHIAVYCIAVLGMYLFELTGDTAPTPGQINEFLAVLFATYLMGLALIYMERQSKLIVAQQREFSEQKMRLERMNDALEEKEKYARKLALVAENANDSVIISTPGGVITWVNETFCRSTGYSIEEAVGSKMGDLLNGEETDPVAVQEIIGVIETKKSIRTQLVNYVKSGEKKWVEVSIFPILDDDGEISMIINVERDITAQKHHEIQLSEARVAAEEGARAKTDFLATMSHEIRTPMNGIVGMADLLIQSGLNEEQQVYAETIIQSGDSLVQIINDILDLTKLDADKLDVESVPFTLMSCFETSLALLRPIASDKGLEVKFSELSEMPETVLGDPGRLRQIMLNLLGNAIKFTSDGSVHVLVGWGKNGNELKVEVRDTGVGIAPERIGAIFEKFSQAETDTTRKFGGTGLGLTISRLLAEKMGGEITAKSELGVGSSFCVTLPLIETVNPKLSENKVTAEANTDVLSGLNILVAEDNKTNRLLIDKYLSKYECQLTFAEDGEAAVAAAKKTRPDVILMDISMPKLNGHQATREIRNDPNISSVVIIALTANAFQSDRDECIAAGMDGFLTKPIKKRDLLNGISEYVERKHGSHSD